MYHLTLYDFLVCFAIQIFSFVGIQFHRIFLPLKNDKRHLGLSRLVCSPGSL
ncbi:mCG147204 [Mus musculus]|nr:mCG147204 [Mus musculus]